ncbi:GDSL family lipase [Reichenbachiella sp. 5M10]|uniref:rhamnogalacturonan acetylesterase n=1 Tax=Reichenbachiella sp. 5M10 TaxID=1889772 RepID=UPI000C14E486|nr:rhamnogalacturonan acetylesterase [Reichenbachiella sp. 5M10]PIB35585.1 GDSL family lipase [Reichenbachiella sp. 5M10]
MNVKLKLSLLLIVLVLGLTAAVRQPKTVTVYLIGDSTMADYNLYEGDYMTTRYPLTGWGQVFQPFFVSDSLSLVRGLISADSVRIDDRARGGRSTRTFFQEGRWRGVYESLQQEDVVLMQFGHNDAAVDKTERYVDVEGYKEFLRLYISQTLAKGAIPVVLTPVARNYPWENEHLENVHGDYPQAAKDVAAEYGVELIDLNQLSMDAFSSKGKVYVTENYFMNLSAGQYGNYPEGKSDNTHFQPEGAQAVAQLVFDALQGITR